MNIVRIVVRVLGIAMLAIGGIWILQGLNILPGSFMTGDINWSYRGAAVLLVGVALFWWAMRKPRSAT